MDALINSISRMMARRKGAKKRSFVQDVLISRSPGMGESDLHVVNEHFERLYNAASAGSAN